MARHALCCIIHPMMCLELAICRRWQLGIEVLPQPSRISHAMTPDQENQESLLTRVDWRLLDSTGALALHYLLEDHFRRD